ncbi:2-amino-4-hydroxy-6-hydroxymethyldihydropteridine diphosphokinase [Pseudidiomarina terrestris]|uniref:2-amino-4-hydroxy-6- hydroxymethyldihydropteridine diphosphokinase n=1 Tax=Pseudidiomarina terrestris TaxID=2820060 RepID=UPI00264E7721|nr:MULTISPECIES: 2-amino-4-hydroxy-6-hydroxymethyldihydropteridine diphosphokinase [unclassified Pseudidiomarina]MDN7127101.1 2-amino-4-hydroxy-6-hydroxymethyldihydropteridine diphosphokinase [Pseudidiomarina sp. 1APR75-33.1]MDN7135486.1 2-amino-4-hydroxy-6-hydroxymethyldihydropteridine diphosphokinase [Pseudidiomarina sp. 1ASP75-5]
MVHVYLCSMGANIAPEENFSTAQSMIRCLGRTIFSDADYTRPVDINTQHDFLNALFIIETDLTAEQLKEQFNAIEERLGRDRSDPRSSEKDRPMDIDILGQLRHQEADTAWENVPEYLQGMCASLKPAAAQLEHTA